MSEEYFEIEKQKLNFEKAFEEISKSKEFEISIKENPEKFKELFQELNNRHITTLDFLHKCAQILAGNFETLLATSSITTKEELVVKQKNTPSIINQENGGILIIKKHEGRRRCPQCLNDDQNFIRESIDKTNIIFSYPKMYGMKKNCGKCGCIWRET
ncbi:hypothetical protein LCGC14_1401750 [marine sediment metagenome]|uniref:Uncharacterized protein n=1 Tax=marine sediment metagenome TaxID=412755 RepID=A0A0F9MYH4_9ZZZZ